MKKLFAPLFIAASAGLYLIDGYFHLPPYLRAKPVAISSDSPAPKQDASSGIPGDLAETIAASEYHISFDAARRLHQSPNRQQNLRAYYRPGHFSIQNRMDAVGQNFKLALKNEGINADGIPFALPDPAATMEVHEHKLRIRHLKFTEEYINNEAGIRQNFIIDEAPGETKKLQVRLSAEGLSTQKGDQDELRFFAKDDPEHPRLVYRDLHCWDAENRPLEAELTSQGKQIFITVNVSHAAYPVTIDPIVVNGNPGNANAVLESNQADAWLGFSVSSAGDVNADGYSDVLAGAPYYDNGEDGEGAAFLYYGSANGLNPIPAIFESNQANAALGYSVCGSGDINGDGFSDIALGAPYYDKGQPNEGAVFVHLGSPKGVKPNPVVVLEGNQSGANFGIAVALAGDINGDGHSDLITGASEYQQGQPHEGAAFVFFGDKVGIDPNKVITLQMDQSMAKMGATVAGAGDINADGFSDVLVGAPFFDQNGANEGSAFVYLGSAQGVSLVPTILPGNQDEAHFGSALATAGDLNADGYADIVVGAPHYDKAYADQGMATIYFGSANGINPASSTALAGSQMQEEFGRSVACAGDMQGDGYADLLIASRSQGKSATNEGIVMLYSGVLAGINKKPTAIFKSNQPEAYLGQSVASAGDVNGDGFSDILLGAHLYDNAQNNEGAIMIWHGGASGASTSAKLPGNQPESAFGYAVSGAGDVNGDGYDDVIIGAPRFDNGQADEGAAFVFLGAAGGLHKTPGMMLEADQPEAGFGSAVSAAGDVNGDGYGDIIVGALHYDDGETEEGAAFFYAGSANGINPVPIKLQSNVSGAWFGCAVSHAGDLNGDGFSDLIVGAMNYSNGESVEGACYLIPGSANGPDMAAKRIIESDQEDARLGNAVAAAGDLNGDGHDDIVMGAYSVGDDDAGAIMLGYGKDGSLDSLQVTMIKGVHAQAHFGWDVSGAGDVNADGFGDIVVGAHAYNNGDGAGFVYYGAAFGISVQNVTALFTHETGMAPAMGESVAGVGDLDGDGYGDIAIGEPWYVDENTWIETGLTMIYYGSPAGINTGPQRIKGNANDEFDYFGWAVAAAGDVNADGHSDLLVGSPNFSTAQTDGDAAFVYFGNVASALRNNIRLYNSDLVTGINQSQKTKSEFGIGFFVKSFLGRNLGKLVWETRPSGQGFSVAVNGKIMNSTFITGSQKGFTPLPSAGAELKATVAKQGLKTRLRARAHYSPVGALTGQLYGRWRYLSGELAGTTSAPVPRQDGPTLKSGSNPTTYVYPNPATSALHIEPGKNGPIAGIALSSVNGRLVRSFQNPDTELDLTGIAAGNYVLHIRYLNGTTSSQVIIVR